MTMPACELEDPLEHEIDPELQKELLGFPGKWAAITRSDLLAVGDSAIEVVRQARKLGFDNIILYRVPDDTGTSYFF